MVTSSCQDCLCRGNQVPSVPLFCPEPLPLGLVRISVHGDECIPNQSAAPIKHTTIPAGHIQDQGCSWTQVALGRQYHDLYGGPHFRRCLIHEFILLHLDRGQIQRRSSPSVGLGFPALVGKKPMIPRRTEVGRGGTWSSQAQPCGHRERPTPAGPGSSSSTLTQ